MMISVLRGFCAGVDALVRICGKVASLLMPVLALVVAFEVFSRYILNSPTIWGYDFSLFMFGYIAALGGAYAQQKGAHINVDILYAKVSPRTRALFNIVSYALCIFFLLVMVKMSFGKYEEAIEFNYRRQSEWAPPMFHFWIMICIAASLFIAQLARDTLAEAFYLVCGRPLIEESGNGN